ncbi:MAG: hypothetical protein K2H43_01340, partial [Clostridia bacterium]|nr:hypothetical protein [Clostridia bacterium]
YVLFIDSDNVRLRTYDSLNLNSHLSDLTNKKQSVYVNGVKNRTYYISLQSSVTENVRIAIVEPPETNETEVYETGTYKLEIKEKLPAELKFHPKESGIYTLTLENGNSGYLIESISPATHQPILGESSENGTLEMKVLSGEITQEFTVYRWLRFSSSAATPSYPIEITVTIEKTGEIVEQTAVINDAVVSERLTKYGAQQGELMQLGVDGTNGRVVKGEDGFFHLDSEDGPVVVVKLKGTIDVFYPDIDFESLDENSAEYTIYLQSDTAHIYYINYAKFLRGYNYGDKDNTGAYASEYYLKYVNDDGVYPLTEELKTFLQRMAAKNQNWLIGSANGYSADSLWLFSAYFYNDGTYTPPDPPVAPAPITGNGTQETPYLLAFAEGENTLQSTVSIDVTTSEQTGSETPDSKHFRFTPSESGYYVLKLLHRDAQFMRWDGTSFRGGRTDDKQYAYYGTTLEAGEAFEFALTCTAQNRYPFTYSYQIYQTDPPAIGSADNPVMVGTQSYTIDLKAGERYFFGIDMNEGYRINFTSDSVKLYDLGSSVSNDDRIKADYLLEDNSEVVGRPATLLDTYIVVIPEEDCSVTITFTQIS